MDKHDMHDGFFMILWTLVKWGVIGFVLLNVVAYSVFFAIAPLISK